MKKNYFLFLFLILSGFISAQQSYEFSLEEAKEYALKNNRDVKNAALEVIIAQKKIWETTAMGLPQVDASVAYQNIFDVPTVNFPSNTIIKNPTDADYVMGEQIVTPSGTYALSLTEGTPIELAVKENTTIDITVSQLIFSGSYLVGLQASKVYKSLSEEQLENAELDTKAQVSDSYYLILVLEENLSIIQGTLENIVTTESEISAMLEEGFVEDTDLDQITLNKVMIQNAIVEIENQVGIAYELIKMQLGVDASDKIILTEDIESLKADIPVEKLIQSEFNLEQNLSYRMLQTQEELAELDWKLQKTEFLPTVAGYYRHEEVTTVADFNTSIPDMVGLSVDIPIFHSAGRFAKVKQAKLRLEQTRNTKDQAVQGLKMQVTQARNNFSTAVAQLNNQKKNMNLSQRIYDKTLMKYKEGLSSSMDLTQANNQLLSIQQSYYQALLAMLQTKVELNKKLNNL